ncbi:MAG: ABC transporter ATP-binding protein [Bryobacteraceae bacterium]|nr:ABC transporter ATP-binding protein [Bryobacteraceae bacterium]
MTDDFYELTDVGLSYNGASALSNISLRLQAGELVAIAGPNGAGKSTLLNILAKLRPGYSGSCRLQGREIREWKRPALARLVSVVPQGLKLEFPFTGGQLVLMGRTPWGDSMFESAADVAAVDRALKLTGTEAFRDRNFSTLSGGERQRLVLASALAQEPKILLLDEPTTYLDLEHQISLYRLLRSLAEEGLLVVTVTHDLNLAVSYSDRILLLRSGKLVGAGPPAEVLNSAMIRDVFAVEATLHEGPAGRPWLSFGH